MGDYKHLVERLVYDDPVLMRCVRSPGQWPVLLLAGLCCLLGLTTQEAGAAEEALPSHQELPAGVIAYVVIPHVPALLDHLQTIVAMVRKVHPGRLLSQVSLLSGDAGFAHLDGSRPVVVALLSSTTSAVPAVAAWIPTLATEPAPYAQMARIWGLAADTSPALTVLAGTDDDLPRAQALIAFYQDLAANPPAADIRLHVACDRAWLTYGDALREQEWLAASRLAYLPHPAGAPDFVPAARLGLAGSLGIAQDLLDLTVDLSADGHALSAVVDGISQPGSALSQVLVAPSTLPDAGAVLGPGAGITTIVARIDPQAFSSFVTVFLSRVAAQQSLPLNAAVMQLLSDYGSGTTGSFALRVAPDAVHGVSLSYVHGVTSAAAGLAFARRMVDLFTSGTATENPGAKLGLPMNASLRMLPDGAAGAPSALLSITMLPNGWPLQVGQALGAYLRDTELAFTPGWTVCVQDTTTLEGLSIRAQAAHLHPLPVTLAETVFPSGYDVYLDSDLVGMVLASLSIINPDGSGTTELLHQALAKHQQREPLVLAGRFAAGATRWRLHVPLAPLAALVDAGREAMEPAPVAPAAPTPAPAPAAAPGAPAPH